jgi:hypothetical protein
MNLNFNNKFLEKIILPVFVFLLPVVSFAQVENCDPTKKICNPLGGADTLPVLIQKVLEGFVKIGLPIVVLAIVFVGFQFVFAVGNSEKIKGAKNSLLYVIIGAALLLGSWAIAKMISVTVSSLGS